MAWLRKPLALPLLGLGAILALEVAILLGLRAMGIRLDDGGRMLLFVLLSAPALWLVLLYWRRIDELARDAQKTAWFWGGSLGMGIGLIGVAVAGDPRFGLAELIPAEAPAALYAGGVAVATAQIAGFFLGWIIWWMSKR